MLFAACVPALLSSILALLAILAPAPAAAQDEATLERRVKAANVYKFAGYVEWPESVFASPSAPLAIGVLGDDAIAGELAQVVAGRSIDAHPLAVRRVRPGDSLAGLHILFIGASEKAHIPEARTQPLLLVTENEGALDQGSVINFLIRDGRVRFEVALDNAERRGLRLSSRLLTVAYNVRTGPP